jgi:hypothetical protein
MRGVQMKPVHMLSQMEMSRVQCIQQQPRGYFVEVILWLVYQLDDCLNTHGGIGKSEGYKDKHKPKFK